MSSKYQFLLKVMFPYKLPCWYNLLYIMIHFSLLSSLECKLNFAPKQGLKEDAFSLVDYQMKCVERMKSSLFTTFMYR